MNDDYESAKSRRAEFSERFWDQKARFTYYTLSLPFALAGVAIASYPYPDNVPLIVVLIEVASWVLLLSAGAAGLRAKWGEMEQSRKSSIIAAAEMRRFQEGTPRDPAAGRAVADVAQKHEEGLRLAEKAEDFGIWWLYRVLAAGLFVWLTSRSILAIGALGA